MELTEKQIKALNEWTKWYSAKLDRINDSLCGRKKPTEGYSGYEQDLFEAFGCISGPFDTVEVDDPGPKLRFVTDMGPVDKVYLDGYSVGDRLLEGVLFECVIVNGKITVTGVAEHCRAYFEQLNTSKWLAAAQAFSQNHDIFSTEDGTDAWAEIDV